MNFIYINDKFLTFINIL